ncbi:MAG: N(G),N(G)-dimethylarginine dimethylaminohydrolase [Bacteroidetes bacterium HGW-Bacteroidetes-17]|jgi:dimethylargininase|nr:MAG: N(G),N(G)-dimethylarginine dimethylaminohydrolase [Bacteroidetes bacterium HGW-Bacteroidetes-17]
MFKYALVRKPAESMIHGITRMDLGKPEFQKALNQHDEYCKALKKCGLAIVEIPAEPNFPDSVFVEDTAIVTEKCAIITFPGHVNRRGEELSVASKLAEFRTLEYIKYPGTLDGGDIMRAENHFFIGLSDRTNKEGAEQLMKLLAKYGHTSSMIAIDKMLHLKTGINYVGNQTLVMIDSLLSMKGFDDYKKISIPDEESYAANCLLINDYLLVAKGFESAKKTFVNAGFKIIELEMSEYMKLDGGLSCLSLRF